MIADHYQTSRFGPAEAASPRVQLKAAQYQLNIGLKQGINGRVLAIGGDQGSLPETSPLFVRKYRTFPVVELSMKVKPADECANFIGAAL